MGAPLLGTTFHEPYTAGGVTGFCFEVKEMQWRTFFFGRHEGKLETFAKNCVAASLETLRDDPAARVRDKQAVWKLLSKISRTTPDSQDIGYSIRV